MKKITLTLFLIFFVIAVIAQKKENKESKLTENKKIEQKMIKKCNSLLVSTYKNKLTWKCAPLNDGVAIMGYLKGSAEAAFWISNEGVVYAANGTAMAWTGHTKIEYASTGIHYGSVLKAVERQ